MDGTCYSSPSGAQLSKAWGRSYRGSDPGADQECYLDPMNRRAVQSIGRNTYRALALKLHGHAASALGQQSRVRGWCHVVCF